MSKQATSSTISQAVFDRQQEEACQTLNMIEGDAWDLHNLIREFRNEMVDLEVVRKRLAEAS